MKIYTKKGDAGDTGLFGGGRVPKSDPRVDAYGHVDELNAWIGVARAWCREESVLEALAEVQGDLFVVGAILATPNPARRKGEKFTLHAARIEALEEAIDAWEEDLGPLRSFVLPGGGRCGALLHAARTVCRRAERAVVGLGAEELPDTVIPYLNRLSDWLFVCARWVNREEGEEETTW